MLEKLNKKSAIAIAIVVILGILAVAGTVIFLKDKGSTDAAEIASENSSNSDTTEQPNEESKENNQANSSDTSDKNEQEQNNNNQANSTNNDGQGNNTNNNQQRQNRNTNVTTNDGENTDRANVENGTTLDNTEVASSDVDTIQGSTITRVTEGDLVKVTDDRNVAWNPMDFEIQSASAKIDGEKSKITIEKKAATKTGSNLVAKGEEIEYTLIVKNNSDEDLKSIEVSDNIPENTTYVENTASDNANVIRENDIVVGLKWYVDISAGNTVELKFKVKVNEDITGTISNVALTNGNTPSEDVKTAIIEASKSAEIEGKDEKIAKIGDKVNYTISVKNTGEVDGTTTIKDKDLQEILADNKAEMVGNVSILKNDDVISNDKTAQDLINGIEDIEVPAQGEAKVVFTIKINKIDGEIKNIALIGDEEKPTEPEVVDTVNITGEKINTPEKEVKENDIINYTILLSNSGSIEGETLVKDPISEYVEFVNSSIKVNDKETKYTQNDLEKGISIAVPVGKDTAKLSFKVKVKFLSEEKAEIKNTAYIGENSTNEVTNEAEKIKVSLTVNKTWDDNEIQAKRRPKKITFTLLKYGQKTDMTQEVDSAKITDKAQNVEFTNLDKYDENGKEIPYGIEETGLNEFYTSNISNTEKDNLGNNIVNVKNSFKIPENNKTNVSVTKVWKDDENKAGKRPEKITLTVSGNDKPEDVTLSADNKKEDDENTWVSSVEMPKYNENGEKIVYTASENNVPKFYEKTEKGLKVTNKFVGSNETISIKINKTWVDNDIQEAHRPESINFTISDGKKLNKELTLGNEDNASVTESNLPKYDKNADEIKYTVTESRTGLEFYTSTQTEVKKDEHNIEFNFVNTFGIPYEEKETKITLIKKWDDESNKAGKRPQSVVFTVSGTHGIQGFNETLTEEANKVDDNTWKKTIKVAKYTPNGELIDYSAIEKETGSIFYTNVDDNLNDLTVTNKFELPENNTRKIKIVKNWDDTEAQKTKRPNSIMTTVTGGGNTYNVGVAEGQKWQKEVSVRNYDDNGDRIEYEVSEQEINKFYELKSIEQPSKENNDTATITNKFKVPDEKIKVDVIKKWEDNDKKAQRRPETIKFTLVKYGKNTTTTTTMTVDKTKTEQNAESFTGLPRYDENGDEIDYTAQETFTSEFYKLKENGISKTKDSNGNVKVEFTNKFELPADNKKDITLKKVWEDNGNKSGKRPNSIVLQLNGKNHKLTGENGNEWTKTIKNQPIYNEDGEEISYIVTENNVPNFYEIKGEIVQPTIRNNHTATVTNEFKKPTDTKTINITKTWDDNKEEHQEIEAEIIGIAKNEVVNTEIPNQKLNKKNGWKQEVTVPVYDENADEITYSVKEANIPDGYIVEYNGLEIINRLPSMKVTKTIVSVNGKTQNTENIPEVKTGDVLGYKITVENTSNVKLTNVRVTDDRLISLLPDGVDDNESLTNLVGKIDELGAKGTNSARKEFIVYYKVKAEDTNLAGKEIVNTAKATGNYKDSNESNKTVEAEDTEKVVAKAIDGISIVKQQFVNDSKTTTPNGTEVKENDKIDYRIIVTNTGNTVLSDARITDSMTNNIGNLQINEADKNIGTLQPGETKTINAKYEPVREDFSTTSKTIMNTATAKAKNRSGNLIESEESSVNVKTIAGKPEFEVTKSSTITKADVNKHKDVAEYGDTIKYIIDVKNKGKLSGTTTVKDTVPEGTTLLRTGTNLSDADLNQLESERGLSKDITLAANTSTTIEFTVRVTGKAGSKITNTATYKTDENENTPSKDLNEYSVEKEVKLTKNSEVITTTNSNIVLVMDVSGSMAGNRLLNSKAAAKKLIDGVDFTSGGQIGIVTFSSWNNNYDNANYLTVSGKNYVTNLDDAETLKTSVDGLNAYGGTRIADGLVKAKSLIEEMATAKPNNKNIVIVLSDGVFNKGEDYNWGGCGQSDCLYNTGHETLSRVTEKANALKGSSVKPTVYSVAIVNDASENPGNTNIMTEIIPSDKTKYIKTTDGYDSIINAFKEIGKDVSGDGGKDTLSANGMIELTDIKSKDTVKIKVNNVEITDVSKHLKTITGKTYVDLSTFAPDAKIEIEYTTNN